MDHKDLQYRFHPSSTHRIQMLQDGINGLPQETKEKLKLNVTSFLYQPGSTENPTFFHWNNQVFNFLFTSYFSVNNVIISTWSYKIFFRNIQRKSLQRMCNHQVGIWSFQVRKSRLVSICIAKQSISRTCRIIIFFKDSQKW